MMTRYAALLRAINVGGHSVLAMSDLRKAFEDMGYSDVATHIQTGNVVFTASDADDPTDRIEDGLASSLGYRGTVFVLTPAQLEAAARSNPFDPEVRDDEQHSILMFLSEAPDAARCNALMAMEGEEYRLHVRGKVLYYAYSRSREGRGRRTIDFEKVLGVKGTSRTWKVVQRLIEMASEKSEAKGTTTATRKAKARPAKRKASTKR